ncbi:MAG: iron ABC transporter permease [Moraxellaceae bacterium]|nr:iron ABC transporter permease [Moraxellaceae bacterium]
MPKNTLNRLILFFVALFMLIPIAVVMFSWTKPMAEIWSHLREYILPEVLKNTAIMLLMVIIGAGGLGTLLAWFTSMYRFTGQKFFSWALMLPLAIPAYVLAFISVGIFDYSGVIQSTMRAVGIATPLPSVRNIWGAGVVLSLAFYPYVYLLARQAFLSQGRRTLEAGEMLGQSRLQIFFCLGLPQASPWIIGGLLLACMETLADFGAVSVFNVNTFTTAIYKAWFGFFSLTTSAQLSALLIIVVFMVVLAEQYWQAKREKLPTQGDNRPLKTSKLAQIMMFLICSLVFLFAFALPIAQLLYWTAQNYQQDLDSRYWDFVLNTILIASMTTVAIAIIAIILAWIKRKLQQVGDNSSQFLISLANLGYSVPSTVLAVGVFIPIAWADNQLITWGITKGQVLSGSVLVMLLALITRFMTVGFQPIDRQLQRLSKNQLSASEQLTEDNVYRWRKLILPVLRPAVFTALLMVFVEVMKEMPITLMTRRQGWDTLAVRVFEMTSEGMWGRASLPSLLIVLVGLVPVWLILKNRGD